MSSRPTIVSAFALGLALVGCAVPQDALPTEQAEQALGDCPEEYCGTNSPKIEALGFHELHLDGLPNSQGMWIVKTKLYGQVVDIKVVQGRLWATDGAQEFYGAALVGLEIDVFVNDRPVTLTVRKVSSMRFPVPSGTTDVAETYTFEYFSGGVRRNLCGGRPVPDPVRVEAYGQSAKEAVLFEGDRIDTTSMTIAPSYDPRWFNIGCAGHTLSKLHLTRHTTASGAYRYSHTRKEAQATLKMLVADYCGTGRPFTVAGQPLAWHDARGLLTPFPVATTLDARWNEEGATCIAVPRMSDPVSDEGKWLFPDIRYQIDQECHAAGRALPPCASTNLEDFEGALRVSANRTY